MHRIDVGNVLMIPNRLSNMQQFMIQASETRIRVDLTKLDNLKVVQTPTL